MYYVTSHKSWHYETVPKRQLVAGIILLGACERQEVKPIFPLRVQKIGWVRDYVLDACPVFVAGTGMDNIPNIYTGYIIYGTGREMSSPSIDKPGILTPIFCSISGVLVRIVQQLLPVPFRSVPGFISSHASLSLSCDMQLHTRCHGDISTYVTATFNRPCSCALQVFANCQFAKNVDKIYCCLYLLTF